MTPISAEALLSLMSSSSRIIEVAEGEHVEVIDATDLAKGLQALIDARPQNRFANIIGMTPEVAQETLEARSPYELSLTPVRKVVVFLRDGNMTPALMERASRVRGTSGVFDGRGMANDDELAVVEIDGMITEILDLAR